MDTALLIESAATLSRDLPAAAVASRALQQLWFSLAARRWTSLVLVPAPGVESTLPLATSLLQVSRRAGLEPRAALIDGTRLSLEQTAGVVHQLGARLAQGERALVALDRLEESPAALALISRCDAAILCVGLGRSDLGSARQTLERCGRARFLGSVVVTQDSTR